MVDRQYLKRARREMHKNQWRQKPEITLSCLNSHLTSTSIVKIVCLENKRGWVVMKGWLQHWLEWVYSRERTDMEYAHVQATHAWVKSNRKYGNSFFGIICTHFHCFCIKTSLLNHPAPFHQSWKMTLNSTQFSCICCILRVFDILSWTKYCREKTEKAGKLCKLASAQQSLLCSMFSPHTLHYYMYIVCISPCKIPFFPWENVILLEKAC
jgi:hypothetical protein